MKRSHTPLVAIIVAALVGLGTAIANANGVFAGHPHLYYWVYGAAVLVFLFGLVRHFSEDSGGPRIVPIRYGHLGNGPVRVGAQWVKITGLPFTLDEVLRGDHLKGQGLIFRNDGDPAYHISIPDSAPVGTSKLRFEGRIDRLDKTQGEALLTGAIERDSHSLVVNALLDEMKDNNVDALSVKIQYRGDNHKIWWATSCEIERNVSVTGGLQVRRFSRKRISKPASA